jgi:hypothetical protein
MGATNREGNKCKAYRREVRRASQLTPPAADGFAALSVFRRFTACRRGRRTDPRVVVHARWCMYLRLRFPSARCWIAREKSQIDCSSIKSFRFDRCFVGLHDSSELDPLQLARGSLPIGFRCGDQASDAVSPARLSPLSAPLAISGPRESGLPWRSRVFDFACRLATPRHAACRVVPT